MFTFALILPPAGADAQTPRIANGVTTSAWPEVGVLLVGTRTCTATFVGCRTAITAAHCVCVEAGSGPVCGDGTFQVAPSEMALFLPQGGVFPIASISVPPDYTFAQEGDLAVLALDVPLRGVRPRAINEQARLATGTPATIVGFGAIEEGSVGSGLLREGRVVTAPCLGELDPAHVCWDFLPPIGLPGLDSNTCPGDSGGPLLADLGAGFVVAGVHSGGFLSGCHVEDFAFDTDVFVERAWIRGLAGVDLDRETCGGGAPVGDPAVGTVAFEGVVTGTVSHSFAVPPETKLLRIGLTGTSDGDIDLLVRAGAPPTAVSFDCASAFTGSFEYCEIEDPAPGTWFARIDQFFVSSTYQLTVTLLPETPPPPAPAVGQVVVSNFTGFELTQIDLVSGARAVVSSSLRGAGPTLTSPEGLVRDADGTLLVASPTGGHVVRIDPTSGDRVVVSGCADSSCTALVGSGPSFFGPRFVAFADDGAVLVADRSVPGVYAIVRVEPDTGERTTLSGCLDPACNGVRGAGPSIGRLFGLALDPDGRIFVADGLAVHAIDAESGDRTLVSGCTDAGCALVIGDGPAFGEPGDLVVASDGSLLVSYRVEGEIFGSVRRVDPETGDRTLVSGCEDPACSAQRGAGPPFADPFGVAFDREGHLLVADGTLDALLRVELVSGDRTLLSGCADPSCQSAFGSGPDLAQPLDIALVPEPGAGCGGLTALLAIGALASGRAGRRCAIGRLASPCRRARRPRADTFPRRWTELPEPS